MNIPATNQNSMNSLTKRIQRQAETYIYQKIQEANLTLAESLPVGEDDILSFGVVSTERGQTLSTLKVWCSALDNNITLNLILTKQDGSVMCHDEPVTTISEPPLNVIDSFITVMKEIVKK